MVIVDEAENFVTPTIAKGMAMARSNRSSYVLAMQNLNQIQDPALRENLVSVSGNKVVMAGVGNYDAEQFSKLFGAQELEYTSASTSRSTGTNTGRTTGRGQQGGGLLGSSSGPHYQSSRASSSSASTTSGSSNHFRVRPNFLPGEIRELPVHHALIETRDNQGRVTPATLVQLDRELVASNSIGPLVSLRGDARSRQRFARPRPPQRRRRRPHQRWLPGPIRPQQMIQRRPASYRQTSEQRYQPRPPLEYKSRPSPPP